MENNRQILKGYDSILYEFKCNEETIKALSKMSAKSDLTAQQAKLIMSQVSYEVKLAEYDKLADKGQERLMKQIERQINTKEESQPELS